MAPKGKKGKKQQDDWENELGEDVAQTNGGEKEGEQPDVPVPQEDGEDDTGSGGGGLLAMLKKNKEKRKKKGKQDNDFVEGEDIAALANGEEPDAATNGDALANKAPEEATFDDEDVFAGNANKKGKKGPATTAKAVEEDDDDNDSVASGAVGGGVKSKKEKEKERKEREKQRKREQVSTIIRCNLTLRVMLTRCSSGCKEENRYPCTCTCACTSREKART